MKRFSNIISILALAILAGCVKVEVDVVPALEEQEEISFNVANRAAATKAEFGSDKTFKVFGLYTGSYGYNEINFSDAVLYMDGVNISKVGGTWKNSSKDYFWPKTGKLSFVAFSPVSAGLQFGSSRNSVLWHKDYIVEGTYADQTEAQDLLVSKVNADQTASANAVTIEFRHALSQVKFTAKTVDADNALKYEVSIDEIALTSIYNKADYSYDSAADKNVWDVNTGSTTGSESFLTSAKVLSTTAEALGTKDAYYVLPQSLTDNAQIYVKYTIKTCNASGKVLDTLTVETNVKLNTLGTPTINAWESGKSYTYNLTINPVSNDVITFAPAVADWTSTEGIVTI